MKPYCVSCNAELEITPKRYREQGNYCKRCLRGATRRADLRGKIGTQIHIVAKLRENPILDMRAILDANHALEQLKADLEIEISYCNGYADIPIERIIHPYGDRKPKVEAEEVDEFGE